MVHNDFGAGAYSAFLPRIRHSRRNHINGVPVRRGETCPVCGRNLVNIYFRGEEWKCKICWDKEAENHE